MSVNIKLMNNVVFGVPCADASISIEQFKTLVSDACVASGNGKAPTHAQRLIYLGKVMSDASSLSSFNLTPDSVIVLLVAKEPAASSSTAASLPPPPSSSTSSSAAPAPAPAPAPAQQVVTLDQLRAWPNFALMQSTLRANPATLPQLLALIGQTEPAMIGAINADQAGFVALMNEGIAASLPPLGQGQEQPDAREVLQLLRALPVEGRANFAAQMGLGGDQLADFLQLIDVLDDESLLDILEDMQEEEDGDWEEGDEEGDEEGGMGDDGEVALTEEDEAALTRLQELGFTREQCLRCYIDANGDEATAGSLLFEGGLEEDGDDGGYDDA